MCTPDTLTTGWKIPYGNTCKSETIHPVVSVSGVQIFPEGIFHPVVSVSGVQIFPEGIFHPVVSVSDLQIFPEGIFHPLVSVSGVQIYKYSQRVSSTQ
jgi:hypothetical protein